MKLPLVAGQPSWTFASDRVDAAVTWHGGHLAPVRFQLKCGVVEPFSIAPWAEEKCPKEIPPILRSLRGDFFCAPFGGNETLFRSEQHPPHGESANERWNFESLEKSKSGVSLTLSMQTTIRPGQITKCLNLRDGHTAVYCQHVVSGMSGPMNLGHHAMLKFPDQEGAGRISTSAFDFAQVAPIRFEDPALGGYSHLKPGAAFRRLDRVPSFFGGTVDVSRYPARRGFEDLLMVVHSDRQDLAWTAVAFPDEGYLWFSLKNPSILRSTVFWISNGGRHYAPWNGRHTNVMGLEDVTSFFHYGLAESARKNSITRRGFPTSLTLNPQTPLVVNYIMGVVDIPPGFDRVKDIQPERNGVALISSTGKIARTKIALNFLNSHAYETK